MKKVFIVMILLNFLFSKNVLWIYTDLECVKPIEKLKDLFLQNYQKKIEIKLLKAPADVLLKKQMQQNKADLFITDNLGLMYSFPEIFRKKYEKIAVKKLAIISKNRKYTFDDLKNISDIKIGVVNHDNSFEIFKNIIKDKTDGKTFTVFKYFKIKKIYADSKKCFKDMMRKKIDACIDWVGSGNWSKYKKIHITLFNDKYYRQHYIYSIFTKKYKNYNVVKDFLEFTKERYKYLGKKRKRKVNYFLFPDLPL